MKPVSLAFAASLSISIMTHGASAAEADLILHHGKVITLDPRSTVAEALSVSDGRILRVGKNDDVLAARGPKTVSIDLEGKTAIPGFIDSHVHATGACLTEFDHEIPAMESIGDVLDYIRGRARALPAGSWIHVRQVFITRLRETRYPTRAELDEAAPRHPVLFSTGPDASLNTLALKESGIDRDFKITDGGAGTIERDSETGEPTGILRNATRFVKVKASERSASDTERLARLESLLRDYNSVGITAVIDRNASEKDMELYGKLLEAGKLTVRVAASRSVDSLGPIEKVQDAIRGIARDPKRPSGPHLKTIGIKMFLDGGMLTGSAYMREPWGVSKIYSIADPAYRGLLFIPKERLLSIVRTAAEEGLQFTAHAVGDGAVHTLLDVYEEVSRTFPLRATRPCITHSNFMSAEAVALAARLGACVDIQPAWLYLDAPTLLKQFGSERLRWFQPLRSLFRAGVVAGGGSDHMQKIGSLRSVNPYDPFLGMWTAITRKSRGRGEPLHEAESLSREEALRFYTTNNAHLHFSEKEIGSLEEGKLADIAVLDKDILACPVDEIRRIRVLRTFVGGREVYSAR